MNNFCKNCGHELNGARFCPNCGTAADATKDDNGNTGYISNFNILSNEQKLNLFYILSAIPSVVYLILLFCKWVKISVPYIGVKSYGIYNFFVGINLLFDEVDSGIAGIFAKTLAIILIILGITIIGACILSLVRVFRHDNRCTTPLELASVVSMVESGLTIIFILIIKVVINHTLGNSDLDDFGIKISDMISFTVVPILLLIFSILGKFVSDRMTYYISEYER